MPEDERMEDIDGSVVVVTAKDRATSGEPVKSIEGWIVAVFNLHEETSEEDLQDKFAEYGTIRNLHLNLDRRTGYVKGYALVEYAGREEARAAIDDAHGSELLGQKLVVDYAFVTAPPAAPTQEADKKLDDGKVGEARDRSRSPETRDRGE